MPKDKPVFDNCRAGDVINHETAYYNSLFNSEYEEKDDSDYFESYRTQIKANKEEIEDEE